MDYIWDERPGRYLVHKYCPAGNTRDPLARLRWFDVGEAVHGANLTKLEQAVFDGYLRGFSEAEIAQDICIDRGNVNHTKRRALRKLRAWPNWGLPTVLSELSEIPGK